MQLGRRDPRGNDKVARTIAIGLAEADVRDERTGIRRLRIVCSAGSQAVLVTG